MRIWSVGPWAVVGALALMGCSVPVGTGDASAPTTSVHAMYAVTRTSDMGPHGRTEGAAEAVARFIASSEVDPRADDLVGASLVLPNAGSCLQFGRTKRMVSAAGVDLADPGPVTLRVGNHDVAMSRRHVPDVADLVRGSVFTSSVPVGSPEAYEFRSAEGVVRGTLPAEPSHVRVGDDALSHRVVLKADAPLELTWSPTDGDAIVYVDVMVQGGAGLTTRCTFDDHGSGTVPAAAIAQAHEGTLTLHRMRRDVDRARQSELRFDVAVRTSFIVTQSP